MTPQTVTPPTNRTLFTFNCQHGFLIGELWPFCMVRGEKVSYSDCKNCSNYDPYDPDFEPDSLVTINIYGLSATEREKREKRHLSGGPINGDIPRGPEGRRLAYKATFLGDLLKSFAKRSEKGDVFDDIQIHPKEPKLEGGE